MGAGAGCRAPPLTNSCVEVSEFEMALLPIQQATAPCGGRPRRSHGKIDWSDRELGLVRLDSYCAGTPARRDRIGIPMRVATSAGGYRPPNCAAPRAALRVPRAGRHGALCALRACPGADLSLLCAAPDADLSVLHAGPDADLSVLRAAPDAASCVLNAARYRASSAG